MTSEQVAQLRQSVFGGYSEKLDLHVGDVVVYRQAPYSEPTLAVVAWIDKDHDAMMVDADNDYEYIVHKEQIETIVSRIKDGS